MKKQKKPLTKKELFNNENYGNGLRCVIICILAILLVAGINLLSAALPTGASYLDVSTGKIHSISDDTRELVSNLDQKVEVLFICEKGEEDDNTRMVLNLYADQSDNLTVEQVDPAFAPQKVEAYTGETTVDNNTVIVISGDRRQVLDYNDYFAGNVFVLEDYMNSAIEFVTSDSLNKIYTLSGHGEAELTGGVEAYLGLDGFETENLKLLETGKIPEDAKAVLINGLTKDLTEKEAEILLNYLQNGGKLLLVTGYSDASMDNLEKVTDYFGASLEKGVVVESDQNRYAEDNPANVMPNILVDSGGMLTDGVEYVLMPNSKAIGLTENLRESVKVSKILESSETAVSMYQNIFTGEKETLEGPFVLGVSFEEENEDGSETRLLWFSSAYISNESIDAYVGGGNVTLFLNGISWTAEDDPVASIHGKTISTQFLTISASAMNLWKIIMIGIVPLTVLLAGVIVYIRRKKR
ncbi:MAG: Gldg family protein [Anaerovoracaceae bacterium]|nr:Gldg family protein [Anaerovoracaceae bacterium]